MRGFGILLVVLGMMGVINTVTGGAPPTDPAEALGYHLAPLLFLGLGSFLAWKGRAKAA